MPTARVLLARVDLPHQALESLQVEADAQLAALDRLERLAQQSRARAWRSAGGLRRCAAVWRSSR